MLWRLPEDILSTDSDYSLIADKAQKPEKTYDKKSHHQSRITLWGFQCEYDAIF